MAWATVASDLHQLGNALSADIIGWGAAVIGIALTASAVLWVLRIRPELIVAPSGPAFIGKAVALLTEDEMIQERDAQQFPASRSRLVRTRSSWLGTGHVSRGWLWAHSQAAAFITINGLKTSRGWTIDSVSVPTDTTLIPITRCLASSPQTTKCSRSNPSKQGRNIDRARARILNEFRRQGALRPHRRASPDTEEPDTALLSRWIPMADWPLL
jgi:hypothetical protein